MTGVPAAVLDGLAGGGDPAAVEFLARAQRVKHRLLLRHVVAMAAASGHGQAAELAASYELLAAVEQAAPDAVARVLRHPPVGVWAVRAARQVSRGRGVDHGYLAGLVASAAIMAGYECAVAVPLRAGRAFLPCLGQAVFPEQERQLEAVAEVRCGPAARRIVSSTQEVVVPPHPRAGAAGWRATRVLDVGGAQVPVEDRDPYRLPGAGVTGTLDAARLRRWRRCLRRSWDVLAAHHPGTLAELAAVGVTVVPLVGRGDRAVSATHRDAFGALGLSLNDDAVALACALAHERQHAKLNALLDLVALVDDPGSHRWYAPWREDPRPVGALLHGAYAHLEVAAFWRRQRLVERGEPARRAATEFARWRAATGEAVATLRASGALTPTGVRFVGGMHAAIEAWRAERVPVEIARRACADARRHRLAWQRRHGASAPRAT